MCDIEAMIIHGISAWDSDSDSGKSDFDDEYYKYLPPSTPIDKSRIIIIQPKLELILSPQNMIDVLERNRTTFHSVYGEENNISCLNNNTGTIRKQKSENCQPKSHNKKKKKSSMSANSLNTLNNARPPKTVAQKKIDSKKMDIWSTSDNFKKTSTGRQTRRVVVTQPRRQRHNSTISNTHGIRETDTFNRQRQIYAESYNPNADDNTEIFDETTENCCCHKILTCLE